MRLLLTLAAIAYAGVLWEAARGFPLDPARSYLSELAARDQSSAPMFRILDASTGLLVLVALAVGRRTAGGSRLLAGAGIALGAFAVLTMIDAASPMACATSVSSVCAQADAANALGLSHQVHTISSAGAVAAVVVSAILLALAVLRDRSHDRPRQRIAIVAVAVALVVVTGIVTVLAAISTEGGRLVDGGGYAQRAQVLLISAYLVCFGLTWARRGPATAGSSPAAASVR